MGTDQADEPTEQDPTQGFATRAARAMGTDHAQDDHDEDDQAEGRGQDAPADDSGRRPGTSTNQGGGGSW